MGHQPRSAAALLRFRIRLLLRLCYPHFVLRRAARRPLAIISLIYVLSIVATGVYLAVPLTLIPEWTSAPFPTTIWLVVFLWSVSCTIISYMLTALAHPGRVPESWRPVLWQKEDPAHPGVPICTNTALSMPDATSTSDGTALSTVKANLYPIAPPVVHAAGTAMLRGDGRHRFCVHCNVFKPDRAHHCSACRECVLQMDHHCPFTGNSCVGFLNRKFFILFLYYATSSCFMVAFLTPRAIIAQLVELEARPTTAALGWVIMLMIGYMMCALHAIALFPFSAFHTYLVLKNRTTIENQEARPAMHADVLRRSDRGWLNNWKSTFGPVPLLWFIPVAFGREPDVTQVTPARSNDELV